MQCYLVALVVLFVPLAHGFTANKTYPTIAPCKENIVSSIKAYWKTTGSPKDALNNVGHDGPLTVVHTSYDYHNSDNKCIYLKYQDNVFNVIFVPKNGNTPANLTYKVEVDADDTVRGIPVEHDAPEFRFNWYPIYFKNGVMMCYVCSEIEGSHEPPMANILVAGNDKKLLRSSAVSSVLDLLKGWGFQFKYNYGSECFSTE